VKAVLLVTILLYELSVVQAYFFARDKFDTSIIIGRGMGVNLLIVDLFLKVLSQSRDQTLGGKFCLKNSEKCRVFTANNGTDR